MPTFPTFSELWVYAWSLANVWLVIAVALIGLLEVVTFFVRHDWAWLRRHSWKLAVVLLVVAQFGAYQGVVKARHDDVRRSDGEIADLRAEASRLDALLHPRANVYMRWPESWFWNGQRYPGAARIKLDDSAQLETKTRTYQRMDPMIFAPPTQRLTDVRVFLTFSRGVTAIDCDPTRPPLAIWTSNENNSFYSTVDGAINPGSGANVDEAFCFTVAEAGPLGVTYAFSPAETAPIRGHFNIVVKDATP